MPRFMALSRAMTALGFESGLVIVIVVLVLAMLLDRIFRTEK